MFELKALLPIEKDLEVSVRDYDLIGSDDVIGETVVDLENRLLSGHGAGVGLPRSYCVSGVNEWRLARKPRELLEEFCQRRNAPAPVFTDASTVKLGSRTYRISDFGKKKKTIILDNNKNIQN